MPESQANAPAEWLIARAPGFADLSQEERSAMAGFAMLWCLFEARILGTEGSAAKICEVVKSWEANGELDAAAYDEEIAYFRQRYFADGEFTDRFDHLHLRKNDQKELVSAVLSGVSDAPRDRVAALLIIVMRYRNNLFHGVKWRYQLREQLQNFTTANGVLMKTLERHGRLNEG